MFRSSKLMLSNTKCLVFNSGSSTLKYGLFNLNSNNTVATLVSSGMVDKVKNHEVAIKKVVNLLMDSTTTATTSPSIQNIEDIDIVAFRVVHGGTDFSSPILCSSSTISQIDKV